MSDSELPRLDPSCMAFPSDSITLGAMRKNEAELFTRKGLRSGSHALAQPLALYSIELRLAERSFVRTLGCRSRLTTEDTRRDIGVVNDAYKRFGLSSGLNETKELVRAIELEAAQQAQRFRAR